MSPALITGQTGRLDPPLLLPATTGEFLVGQGRGSLYAKHHELERGLACLSAPMVSVPH